MDIWIQTEPTIEGWPVLSFVDRASLEKKNYDTLMTDVFSHGSLKFVSYHFMPGDVVCCHEGCDISLVYAEHQR